MPQAPQQQQQGGLQPSPGQKAALDSFQNQAKPFGWLVDMINHITGVAPPAQVGQTGQPAASQPPAQPAPAGQPAGKMGKQSDAGGQPTDPGAAGGQPGQVAPGQVPDLANVMAPNAGQNVAQIMGLMPQTQGSFGWLLQMLQQQQMKQQQAQGGDLVSLVDTLAGGASGAPGAAGASSGAGAGAAGAVPPA